MGGGLPNYLHTPNCFSQWWSSGNDSAIEAQKAVLSFLPFYPEKDGKRAASVTLVHLSGKDERNQSNKRWLCYVYGYSAGLGLFYR